MEWERSGTIASESISRICTFLADAETDDAKMKREERIARKRDVRVLLPEREAKDMTVDAMIGGV